VSEKSELLVLGMRGMDACGRRTNNPCICLSPWPGLWPVLCCDHFIIFRAARPIEQ
jgi:hypothetical protein